MVVARIILLLTYVCFTLGSPEKTTHTLKATSMDGMIVGGSFMSMSDAPHCSLIGIDCHENKKRNFFNCGASILNQLVLVSAAHCFETCDSSSQVYVFVGSEYRQERSKALIAKKFLIHEDYDTKTVNNDIALILMEKPLKFGASVKRVALNSVRPKIGTKAIVAGWGLVNEDTGEPAKKLKGARQTVISNADCVNMMEMSKPPGTLCAMGNTQSADFGFASRGDSGSGLMIDNYKLVGVVSHKSQSMSYVIVYTDVAYHYEWITNNTEKLICAEKR